MQKINFRITDKGLDVADLFQKCNDSEFMSKPENEAYKAVFPGILSVTNPQSPFCPARDEAGNQEKVSVRIDIGKDRFGRDIIIYRSMSDPTKTCSEILLESRPPISNEAKSKTQEEPAKEEPVNGDIVKENDSKMEQSPIETKENKPRNSFEKEIQVGFTPTVPEKFKKFDNGAQSVNRTTQEIDNERE